MKRRELFKIALTTAAAAAILPAAANLPTEQTPPAPAPAKPYSEFNVKNPLTKIVRAATNNPEHTLASLFTTDEAIELMLAGFTVIPTQHPKTFLYLDKTPCKTPSGRPAINRILRTHPTNLMQGAPFQHFFKDPAHKFKLMAFTPSYSNTAVEIKPDHEEPHRQHSGTV